MLRMKAKTKTKNNSPLALMNSKPRTIMCLEMFLCSWMNEPLTNVFGEVLFKIV